MWKYEVRCYRILKNNLSLRSTKTASACWGVRRRDREERCPTAGKVEMIHQGGLLKSTVTCAHLTFVYPACSSHTSLTIGSRHLACFESSPTVDRATQLRMRLSTSSCKFGTRIHGSSICRINFKHYNGFKLTNSARSQRDEARTLPGRWLPARYTKESAIAYTRGAESRIGEVQDNPPFYMRPGEYAVLLLMK
jgi:hypothetical protein